MATRPSWDETWLEVAAVIARRSKCSRAQVGAVIVDFQNRIVATGYNGPPANWVDAVGSVEARIACDDPVVGWCHRGKFGPSPASLTTYSDCPTVHAEMNALMFADRRLYEGGTLYVTGPVCWSCAKAVANSGIQTVVIGLETEDRSYRDPGATATFFTDCGITVRHG